MTTKVLKLSSLLNVLLLVGCSQQFQDVNSTFLEYWNGGDDIVLSSDSIAELPYSSAYVEINGQGQIFMVLAFAEVDTNTGSLQLKWMSSDRVLIVTENGRVVETLQLPYENLVAMRNNAPAFDLSAEPKSQTWRSRYDWQPDYRFGYHANVTRTYLNDELIITPLNSIETQKFSEKIDFPSLGQTIENLFWVNESGQVVKTIQYLGPDMTKIEMTILKDFKG
ncbi:YjbF family lipoprotein [Vibrio sp. T187]|uniref:YjbF family lipoprotein n=1 Tax=Vibrio TaxID=662 RepID=UPI0010C9CE01|nr:MULTISPECIES: YjbF family lipoprotein [Vibrio]MBW3697581.1 YjbF family lipoprotein [Vibrio sp. T187]